MPLNPLAAIIVSALLVRAVAMGNEKRLVELLAQEGGFIRWLVALAVVLWIYNAAPREERAVIGGLITLAAVGALLHSADAINTISKFVRGES